MLFYWISAIIEYGNPNAARSEEPCSCCASVLNCARGGSCFTPVKLRIASPLRSWQVLSWSRYLTLLGSPLPCSYWSLLLARWIQLAYQTWGPGRGEVEIVDFQASTNVLEELTFRNVSDSTLKMEEANSFETLIPTYQYYEKASAAITLGTCTREALGSNFGQDIGYLEGGSSLCPQSPPPPRQIPR
jgi:hypothetical protein